MLHVARPAYLGYQVCARCFHILCRPPATPWPAGALVSVLTPHDSDPSTPCKRESIAEVKRKLAAPPGLPAATLTPCPAKKKRR